MSILEMNNQSEGASSSGKRIDRQTMNRQETNAVRMYKYAIFFPISIFFSACFFLFLCVRDCFRVCKGKSVWISANRRLRKGM